MRPLRRGSFQLVQPFHQSIKNIEIGLACFDLIIVNDGYNSIETSRIAFKTSDQGIEEGDIDARNIRD